MNPKNSAVVWDLCAWIGVPLIFAGAARFAYLETSYPSEPLRFGLFLAFLLVGMAALAMRRRPKRKWIVLIYPFAMIFVLLAVFGVIACMSGDCI